MELFFTVLASLLLSSLITLSGYIAYRWLTHSPFREKWGQGCWYKKSNPNFYKTSYSRMFYIRWNIRNYKELWFYVIETGLDTDHCEKLWSWSYDILGPRWTFNIFSHLVAILHMASEVPYVISSHKP